ncbi:MAG: GNAT family protein [Ktedonobacteraceae bacterium]
MKFAFSLMSEADAQDVSTWRYEAPYDVYNTTVDGDGSEEEPDITELLDRDSPYYTVRDEQGELVGYFCYGTAGQPWGVSEPTLYVDDKVIVIGLALRPDLTGKGMGLNFVNAGLAFAREQFTPTMFRLYVMTFNKRAIRVYERAGFHNIGTISVNNMHGTVEFVEMECDAS